MEIPSPYFLQTRDWAEFWLKANNDKHEIHQIKCQIETNGSPVELIAFIYQYPWHLGQNFLYIPKGPFLQSPTGIYPGKEQLKTLFSSFVKETESLAKKLKSSFVKIDFDDNFLAGLNLQDNEQLKEFLSSQFKNKFVFNTKKLQYLQTPILAIGNLKRIIPPANPAKPTLEYLKQFFEANMDFWSTVNQNTRRNTRKSVDEDWNIDTNKTQPNFEAFWRLMQETGHRQKFSIHSKDYYSQLFQKDFSRIIIIRSPDGKTHTVWMGISLGGVTTYLYGGNSLESRKGNSQYLMHLAAIDQAKRNDCKIYDMGGYEAGTGYGKFKAGYKGQVRVFLGPVDLVTNKFSYTIISSTINFLKKLQNFLKDFVTGQLRVTQLLFKFIIGVLITTTLPYWIFTLLAYLPNLHTANEEGVEVAIVFGASVDFLNLVPSSVLQKRLDKSIELFKSKKVKTILVSGDNREQSYNEPYVMKKYLTENGVPAVNVVEDFAGRRTIDTCWRAKNVFKAEKVYLITQRFHLPRADYNCRQVGLQTILAPAEDSNFSTAFWGVIREVPASWLAIQESLRGYEAPVKSDGTETDI